MNSSIEIQTVVLCDDIRMEINGKPFLIGVYSGAVLSPVPVTLNLSLYASGQAREAGTFPMSVRVLDSNENILAKNDDLQPLVVSAPDDFMIAITGIPIFFGGPLTLHFQLSIGGGDHQEVLTKQFRTLQQPIDVMESIAKARS